MCSSTSPHIELTLRDSRRRTSTIGDLQQLRFRTQLSDINLSEYRQTHILRLDTQHTFYASPVPPTSVLGRAVQVCVEGFERPFPCTIAGRRLEHCKVKSFGILSRLGFELILRYPRTVLIGQVYLSTQQTTPVPHSRRSERRRSSLSLRRCVQTCEYYRRLAPFTF